MASDDPRFDVPSGTVSPAADAERPLALAVAAGLVAALAGAIGWALVTKLSGYEIGFVAWGIGFLAGAAVAFAAGRARGPALQGIAVASALVGILLGKYGSYALVVQEQADRAGADVGLFSAEMREFFREDLGSVFGLFDLLFVGLAVYTAWRALERERGVEEQPL